MLRMIGQIISHYRVVEKLGGGGMGVVYKAEDTRLHRFVALKFLPDELAKDAQSLTRFRREARAVSALNHPNIVMLHDISSEAGTDFLVMEYVQGQTLENLIASGGLPFNRVTEYGVQIASALAAAHSAGIVHRDIKPANIMITQDDQIKVLDFGVAKLTPLVGHTPDLETVTQIQGTIPGVVVGTVSYMSPEQTRGEPVDARSDIFSLGCVLYQAATGKRPFGGASTLAIMHEIATLLPPAPSSLCSELPGTFDTLIAACLEKNPIHRPATAGDVAQQLKSLSLSQDSAPPHMRPDRRSVAVMPFKLRTSIQDDQFLAVALADAVVTRLAGTGKLLVRPTASMMRYAGKDMEWTQAAREMNVNLVVEGSIQKMGERVRVLVQAHQVTGALTLYSAKHDGEMEKLFDLQDQIADAVTEALVPQRHKTVRPVPPTKNNAAYELYMRAADRISRLNKWDTQTAVEMLTSATAMDPNFADAWGRLAQACIQMGVVFDSNPAWLETAEAAVAKALALDMVHADAFCARGQLLWTPKNSFQNRPALRALNAALKLNPGCHQAQIWRGLILFHLGLYAEARQGLEEALAVHPGDTRTIVFLAQTALYRGDYEEAYELEMRSLALDPAGVWQNLFFPTIPLYLGRPSEAAEALRRARQMVPDEATLTSVEGLIAAHEGNFGRAEQLADTALESKKTLLHTHHLWHNAASAYAMCSKPEKAVKWLRECADMGLPNYLLFGSDPHLRGLHNRPEFLALMSDLRREHETNQEEFGGGDH